MNRNYDLWVGNGLFELLLFLACSEMLVPMYIEPFALIWAGVCVIISLRERWNKMKLKYEHTESSFFSLPFFALFRILSFHIFEHSQLVWPSNENFSHFNQWVRIRSLHAAQCLVLSERVNSLPLFILPLKIAYFINSLFSQPSFGNLIFNT